MIALDAVSSGNAVNPGTSLTWSHTCTGADRILFVFLRGGNSEGDRVSGVTYNGVAMTKLSSTATTPSPSNQVISGYYLLNPATGSNTVSVSLTSGFLTSASISFTGVLQANFPDSIATNTASSATSLTVSTTTVKNNAWTVLAGMSGGSITAGSGSTLGTTFFTNSAAVFYGGPITPAGSTSMNYTGTNGDYAGIMVSFAPSFGGSLIMAQI